MAPESSFERVRRLEDRLNRRRRLQSIPVTKLADRSNPMENYNAQQFKQRYHMNKDTANYILNLIAVSLVSPLKRGCQIPPALQFLAVVRYYCTGSFQLVIGDFTTMHQSTISRLVRRVSIQIAKLRPNFIQFPNHNEAVRVREAFFRIAGFPGKTRTSNMLFIQ